MVLLYRVDFKKPTPLNWRGSLLVWAILVVLPDLVKARKNVESSVDKRRENTDE